MHVHTDTRTSHGILYTARTYYMLHVHHKYIEQTTTVSTAGLQPAPTLHTITPAVTSANIVNHNTT